MVELSSKPTATLRVCAYVETPWADVVDQLSAPSIDLLLSRALRDAIDPDRPDVGVRATSPELVVGGRARVELSWTARSSRGDERSGAATIIVLPVQTGHDAVTELLVEVIPEGASLDRTAEVTRRFLDGLIARLGRD